MNPALASTARVRTFPAADRLDFRLPDFTRIAWVTDAARSVWEPRLSRITSAWLRLEWLAVTDGARRCALTSVTPEEMIPLGAECAARGLSITPLAMVGATNYSYSASTAPAVAGRPFVYRAVVGRPQDVVEFKAAYDASDDPAIGRLLGFPACCLEFFRAIWVDERQVDTTWPMALRSVEAAADARTLDVAGPPHANILWRWVGVRAVPHLPCSFSCAATVEFGRRFEAIGREHGLAQEMDWMLDVLNWPAEWSTLHGIAEIRTPILKVSTRSDPTRGKYVVRRAGDRYPEEGAQGRVFPYRITHAPVATTAAFKRGIENPIRPAEPIVAERFAPAWHATDNGFSSIPAMEAAHGPVVEFAASVLREAGGDVVDFGCGNGILLARLRESCPAILPVGIDSDADRIEHARQLAPAFADRFLAGDMFDCDALWPADHRYAAAIVMPGRLIETTADRAAQFREQLAKHCDRIVVYAYGDWQTRFGSFAALVERAGFKLTRKLDNAAVGLAAIA